MRRWVYASLGILMVALGAAGIVLPVLPTTPFLLLAAYLFTRSSDRLHDWLLRHRHFGPYIHAWRNRTGLTPAQKLRIGASFTVLMAISIALCPVNWGRLALVGVWGFWTFLLWRIKAAEPSSARQVELCEASSEPMR